MYIRITATELDYKQNISRFIGCKLSELIFKMLDSFFNSYFYFTTCCEIKHKNWKSLIKSLIRKIIILFVEWRIPPARGASARAQQKMC